MSKGTLTHILLGLAVLAGPAGCSPLEPPAGQAALRRRDRPAFVDVPPGPGTTGGLRAVSRTEVTVGQFARYLEISGTPYASPQIRRLGEACLMRLPSEPVAYVSYDQALAYAHWLARRLGCPVDLPTEAEWEHVARGGVPGAPYPWGWGDPARHANFRSAGLLPVGCFPANRFGARDLSGNVAEWCRAEIPDADAAWTRGGSWADRSPDLMRVDRRVRFPRDYRDADVGFRLVMRAP